MDLLIPQLISQASIAAPNPTKHPCSDLWKLVVFQQVQVTLNSLQSESSQSAPTLRRLHKNVKCSSHFKLPCDQHRVKRHYWTALDGSVKPCSLGLKQHQGMHTHPLGGIRQRWKGAKNSLAQTRSVCQTHPDAAALLTWWDLLGISEWKPFCVGEIRGGAVEQDRKCKPLERDRPARTE